MLPVMTHVSMRTLPYKINIHSHTFFSDGNNSPLAMALEAKELDFTALVITDHYNLKRRLSRNDRVYQRAIMEAQEILPVIVGFEVGTTDGEVLLFGGEAIKRLNEVPIGTTVMDAQGLFTHIKETLYAAVLPHPGTNITPFLPYVQGYEVINGGHLWYKQEHHSKLLGRQEWANSDAHRKFDLVTAWTYTQCKITTEAQLVKYIRNNYPTKLHSMGEDI